MGERNLKIELSMGRGQKYKYTVKERVKWKTEELGKFFIYYIVHDMLLKLSHFENTIDLKIQQFPTAMGIV